MKTLFVVFALLIPSEVFAYVALPSNSEYSNGDSYLSDCVRNNGDSNASVCETAARQAFPQDFEAAPVEAAVPAATEAAPKDEYSASEEAPEYREPAAEETPAPDAVQYSASSDE